MNFVEGAIDIVGITNVLSPKISCNICTERENEQLRNTNALKDLNQSKEAEHEQKNRAIICKYFAILMSTLTLP